MRQRREPYTVKWTALKVAVSKEKGGGQQRKLNIAVSRRGWSNSLDRNEHSTDSPVWPALPKAVGRQPLPDVPLTEPCEPPQCLNVESAAVLSDVYPSVQLHRCPRTVKHEF